MRGTDGTSRNDYFLLRCYGVLWARCAWRIRDTENTKRRTASLTILPFDEFYCVKRRDTIAPVGGRQQSCDLAIQQDVQIRSTDEAGAKVRSRRAIAPPFGGDGGLQPACARYAVQPLHSLLEVETEALTNTELIPRVRVQVKPKLGALFRCLRHPPIYGFGERRQRDGSDPIKAVDRHVELPGGWVVVHRLNPPFVLV